MPVFVVEDEKVATEGSETTEESRSRHTPYAVKQK